MQGRSSALVLGVDEGRILSDEGLDLGQVAGPGRVMDLGRPSRGREQGQGQDAGGP